MIKKFVYCNIKFKRLAQLLISSFTNNLDCKVCLFYEISGVEKF